MAKQNLGKIMMLPKGEYDKGVTYEMLDIVTYEDSSYLCKQTSINNLPTNTEYWQLISKGVSDVVVSSTEPIDSNRSKIWIRNTETEQIIYLKNNNDEYEEFIKNNFTNYKSSVVKEDTYVSATAVNWCEVRNGIAYVSMNLTLVAGEMSTASATLVSGLPPAKSNIEIQTHLYNSTENYSIRARVTTGGLLRWWYNPAVTIKSNNALSVNINYPVA